MWLGEVFGGPPRYTEERGGYPHMLAKHRGRALAAARRDPPRILAGDMLSHLEDAAATLDPAGHLVIVHCVSAVTAKRQASLLK